MLTEEAALAKAHVRSGELIVVTEPTMIHTVLGSCVGITFLIRRLGIGALIHAMLPQYPMVKSTVDSGVAVGRKYVDYAIHDLVRQFNSFGACSNEIEVKVFGGADVLEVSNAATRPTVGKMNGEAALRVLHKEGFRIMASSLGGTLGLNLQFNTATGEVLLRRLNAISKACTCSKLRAGQHCTQACMCKK